MPDEMIVDVPVIVFPDDVKSGKRRLGRDELFMDMAKLVALRGTCNHAKVGAVLVRNGRIISMGYNGSPPGDPHCLDIGCDLDESGGCKRTIHAELNAITWAAREGVSVNRATMYVTLSPCLVCARALYSAGIDELIYDVQYRDTSGLRFLRDHEVSVSKLISNGDRVRANF